MHTAANEGTRMYQRNGTKKEEVVHTAATFRALCVEVRWMVVNLCASVWGACTFGDALPPTPPTIRTNTPYAPGVIRPCI